MNSYSSLKLQQQVVDDVLTNFRDTVDVRLGSTPCEVQAMLKYIHEHLFEKSLTVGEVKRKCRLTNNNVPTRFRLSVGRGIREYIMDLRIRAAVEVLSKLEVSIHVLASAAGYTEESFSKLFRKTNGCSPLEYRREILTKENKRNGQERISREMVKPY
ncbi:MAG: AraC family transcriptional regulator [Bacteroidetes bacterium]|nr:AraC family transcriptional regulator [Bacteroidota bacterium]